MGNLWIMTRNRFPTPEESINNLQVSTILYISINIGNKINRK